VVSAGLITVGIAMDVRARLVARRSGVRCIFTNALVVVLCGENGLDGGKDEEL